MIDMLEYPLLDLSVAREEISVRPSELLSHSADVDFLVNVVFGLVKVASLCLDI